MRWIRRAARSVPGDGWLLAVVLIPTTLAFAAGPAVAAPADEGTNVTAYRAEDVAFGTAGDIEAAIDNGTVDPAGDLVVGDRLVVVVDSDRLASEIAAGDGPATRRFFDVVANGSEFRLLQTNPTPERTRIAASIGPENATVFRDGATTYVVVHTGNLTFRYRQAAPGTDPAATIHGGERFAVQFGADVTSTPTGDDSSVPVVEFHPFESEFHASGPSYEPLPPEWVAVAVHVAIPPEESLTVRLRVEDGRTVTVPLPDADPGIERVWLDLRTVEPGRHYVLELVHDGAVTDRYDGVVREPHAEVTNVTLTEVTTTYLITKDGARVNKRIVDHAAVNATVRLSHGGKVEVLNEACEPIGYAWVDAGNETRVSMALWSDGRPLRDLNSAEVGYRVRSLRHRGAGRPRYEGEAASAAVNVAGRCPGPDHPGTPTATPRPRTTTTAPKARPSPRSPTPTLSPRPPTAAPGSQPSPPQSTTPSPATAGASGRSPAESASSTSTSIGEDDRRGPPGNRGGDEQPGPLRVPGFTAPALLVALLVVALVLVRFGARES